MQEGSGTMVIPLLQRHQEGIHLPTAESRFQGDRIQVEQAMRLEPVAFPPDAEVGAILAQVAGWLKDCEL